MTFRLSDGETTISFPNLHEDQTRYTIDELLEQDQFNVAVDKFEVLNSMTSINLKHEGEHDLVVYFDDEDQFREELSHKLRQ